MIHGGPQHCQNQRKEPDEQNRCDEPLVLHLIAADDAQPRVNGNGKNEKAARDVAEVEEPGLDKTGHRRALDAVDAQPVERHGKGYGLLQIGEQQVVDENDVLVVADVFLVEAAPQDQTVRDEGQQDNDTKQRHDGEDAHGYKTDAVDRCKRIHGVLRERLVPSSLYGSHAGTWGGESWLSECRSESKEFKGVMR
jgi:hypothetical protein